MNKNHLNKYYGTTVRPIRITELETPNGHVYIDKNNYIYKKASQAQKQQQIFIITNF